MKKFRKIYIVAITIFICGCSSNYKPPTPASLTSFQPTLQVKQEWSKGLTEGAKEQNLKLTPVINNNRIYVNSYNGDIVAVDALHGKKIWAINTKLNLTSGLSFGSGMIFAGSEDGQITAIREQDGKVSWLNILGGEIIATPTVAGKIILVKAKNGDLNAFNVDTGKFLWAYNREVPSLVLKGDSSAKVSNNLVAAGFSSGELVILDLNSGRLLWRQVIAEGHGSFPVENMVDIDADPQIVDGIVYAVTYQGRIVAIEIKTGHVLWDHEMSAISGLSVDAKLVYVSDIQGYIWSFDRKTGNIVWKQEALLNHNVTGTTLIGNNLIVGDAQGYVHFMSKDDGHFVARLNISKDDAIIAAPLVVDKTVYIYTQKGNLAKLVVG